MRRLPIFVACAALLSLAAVAARVTEDRFLRRGWYRVPSGTVYLSDGKGTVCGYSSWQHFVGAGGRSGAWEDLPWLPRELENAGACPVHADRADWLPVGLVHVSGPTPPMWSDGRGHVCFTVRYDGPGVYVKALPDGLVAEEMCDGERLGKGVLQTPDGQFYESDGDGHVCELLHAGVRQPQSVWRLTEDVTNDGPCPNRTEPPLQFGWFRVANGTLYLSNGSGDACRYSSWEEFTLAGGRKGTWTEIQRLPIGTIERPECESAATYRPGWHFIGPRLEPVFVDDAHAMCAASWQQFFAAGGDLTKLAQWFEDPRVRWLERCAIEEPKKLEAPGWLAAGWFRVANGGIYLSDGRGHVCSYASWAQFTNSPSRGVKTSWTQLDVLPSGLVDDGVCPHVDVENR